MRFLPPQAAFLQIFASNPTGFTVGFLFLPAAQGQELWSNFFQKQTNRSHISLSAAQPIHLPLPCAEWVIIGSIQHQHRLSMKTKLKNAGKSFCATEIKDSKVSLLECDLMKHYFKIINEQVIYIQEVLFERCFKKPSTNSWSSL